MYEWVCSTFKILNIKNGKQKKGNREKSKKSMVLKYLLALIVVFFKYTLETIKNNKWSRTK